MISSFLIVVVVVAVAATTTDPSNLVQDLGLVRISVVRTNGHDHDPTHLQLGRQRLGQGLGRGPYVNGVKGSVLREALPAVPHGQMDNSLLQEVPVLSQHVSPGHVDQVPIDVDSKDLAANTVAVVIVIAAIQRQTQDALVFVALLGRQPPSKTRRQITGSTTHVQDLETLLLPFIFVLCCC